MGCSSEAKMCVYSDSGPAGEGKPSLQGQADSVMSPAQVAGSGILICASAPVTLWLPNHMALGDTFPDFMFPVCRMGTLSVTTSRWTKGRSKLGVVAGD